VGELYPATIAPARDRATHDRRRVRVPGVAGGGASSPADLEGGVGAAADPAEAEAAGRPPERAAGDSRWTGSRAGATNGSG
jgi:hypothetical protein